jgi:molybdopterin-synthase adenylyltransferase
MKRVLHHDRDSARRSRATLGKFVNHRAAVNGLNGIGRQVAAQLSCLNVGSLRLCDAGMVATCRCADQGYFAEDAGRAKVHATAELCHRLNPGLDVRALTQLTPRELNTVDAVFCCPNSPSPQRCYRRHDMGPMFFHVEARFTGEVVRILVACGERKAAENCRSERKAPGSPGRQNPRLPPHIAAMAAAIMVAEFLRFVEGLGVSPAHHYRSRSKADELLQESPPVGQSVHM